MGASPEAIRPAISAPDASSGTNTNKEPGAVLYSYKGEQKLAKETKKNGSPTHLCTLCYVGRGKPHYLGLCWLVFLLTHGV